jgi:hypothetical protein
VNEDSLPQLAVAPQHVTDLIELMQRIIASRRILSGHEMHIELGVKFCVLRNIAEPHLRCLHLRGQDHARDNHVTVAPEDFCGGFGFVGLDDGDAHGARFLRGRLL